MICFVMESYKSGLLSCESMPSPAAGEQNFILKLCMGSGACTSVADLGCLSRIRTVSIPDTGSASKNLSILTPKKTKKWFLSSRKYDPGCSSRIPGPDADFLPIPDPGSRGQKGTGSRIRIRNTGLYSRVPMPTLWCSLCNVYAVFPMFQVLTGHSS